MHFSTLVVIPNAKSSKEVADDLLDKYEKYYCVNCGEKEAEIIDYCDWFSLGGRWAGLLKASDGGYGEKTWTNQEKDVYADNHYDICNIDDLLEPIKPDLIYSVVVLGDTIKDEYNFYPNEEEKEKQIKIMLDDINNKKIKGVVAIIDNHM